MSPPGKTKARPRVRVRVQSSKRQRSAADTAAKAADPPRATDDGYDVGYGRPPRHTQFKPGQSGNPRGRPKGVRSEADILNALLSRKITIQERGRTRQITVMEGAYRAITQNALKGDLKAAAFLFNRKAQIDHDGTTSSSEMNEDDRVVLDSYVHQFMSARLEGGGDDSA